MELEVEVILREIVQPSSPTPDQLRHYQLSFLDQIAPQVYMPFVLFYPEICDSEANKIKASHHLKKSISKALTYFYPLAGRIRSRDNPFVDCNDEGIPFLEAKVKCQISDVIKDPAPLELNKLLPFINIYDAVELPLGIQFNVFECGGIGVGVCMSHILGDALSLVMFVNTWAAIARGEKELILPEFASASLFPPRNRPGYNPNIPASIPQSIKKLKYKRLVFTASKIEEIRGKYADNSSSGNPKLPTRVEALSAFIWSRFAASVEVRSKPDAYCALIHIMNLRTRMDPPLPDNYFGNLYSFGTTIPTMEESGETCHNLVSQIRESMRKIDNDYVKKIQDVSYLDYIKMYHVPSKGERIYCTFTSFCRFPLYEADFGWGKPVWVGYAARGISNGVVFLDTASGNGIEAWINMKDEDMAKFECDEELLAYIARKPTEVDSFYSFILV